MHHVPGPEAFCLAVLLAFGGCSPPLTCTQEYTTVLGPGDTTIAVGQSFTARGKALTCGGRQQIQTTFVWAATDSGIVRVDSLTGQITGASVGRTSVSGVPRDARQMAGWIWVTVVSR